ncbi:hypothetical protein J4408_01455 [Candidatus Pacearchaeota archaeon]|nr:hypothetical protein [Candidatus Pacearchaeota archaeon]
MEQRDIKLTVARYVVANSVALKGMLTKPHYFNFGGKSLDETSCGGYKTFKGYVVDILAERIEERDFFGWCIPDSPNQAGNCGNSKLIPLTKLQYTSIVVGNSGKITEKQDGLLIVIPPIKQRNYLEDLKNKRDFRKYSESVDLGSNFGEKVDVFKGIERLFSNK